MIPANSQLVWNRDQSGFLTQGLFGWPFVLLMLGLLTVASSCSRSQALPAIPTQPRVRINQPVPSLTVTPLTIDPDASNPDVSNVVPVDGIEPRSTREVVMRDWKYVVIHHTATNAGSVESIHRTHLSRKDAAGNPWRGIGYHFVIGNGNGMSDGLVEPTFRWDEQLEGAHAGVGEYNREGIGVCLVGNFEKQAPTESQLAALGVLLDTLTAKYNIPPVNIKGHGDLKSTACPGKLFPLRELTKALSKTTLPSEL